MQANVALFLQAKNNLMNQTKEQKYIQLLPQIKSLIEKEENLIANLANITSVIKETMGYYWVGFYLVESPSVLVLGPFQGPVACTRINYGKGVCGTSWKEKRTIIVPDVDEFPGHIACNSKSRSEIVVPLRRKTRIIGVLDIDHTELHTFDETDAFYLEKILNF